MQNHIIRMEKLEFIYKCTIDLAHKDVLNGVFEFA